MIRAAFLISTAALIYGSGSFAAAQPSEGTNDPQTTREENSAQTPMGDMTHNMDRMATTVTEMARVCDQMMQAEMKSMPYKIAAGVAFGVLVAVVLLLLAVLEVQWIIYWSRLLRAQRPAPV